MGIDKLSDLDKRVETSKARQKLWTKVGRLLGLIKPFTTISCGFMSKAWFDADLLTIVAVLLVASHISSILKQLALVLAEAERQQLQHIEELRKKHKTFLQTDSRIAQPVVEHDDTINNQTQVQPNNGAQSETEIDNQIERELNAKDYTDYLTAAAWSFYLGEDLPAQIAVTANQDSAG